MEKKRRVVVEIREDLHQELRKTAILNDMKLYSLVNAIIEQTLNDPERLKIMVKILKLQAT